MQTMWLICHVYFVYKKETHLPNTFCSIVFQGQINSWLWSFLNDTTQRVLLNVSGGWRGHGPLQHHILGVPRTWVEPRIIHSVHKWPPHSSQESLQAIPNDLHVNKSGPIFCNLVCTCSHFQPYTFQCKNRFIWETS